MSDGLSEQLAVDRLEDVVVSARGELFRDSNILPQSYPPGYAIERRDATALARAAERAAAHARRLDGEWLFLTDHWSGNYYHWLCEALPRLEVAARGLAEPRLLIPRRLHELSFVRQSLEAWPEIAVTPYEGDLAVARLVVPRHVAPGGRQHPGLLRAAAERLERLHGLTAGEKPARRVHVSRRDAARRRIANESDILPVLERHGFETFVFEAMTLREQIALMRGTGVLVGPHGAGFANMVFMPPGGQAVELRQAEGPPDVFVHLARLCGHAYYSLACLPAEPGVHVHAADLVADPAALDALLGRLVR